MKYDLQILVPVIPERLETFQKVGLYNIKNKKILVHCLIGTNKKDIYQNQWPSGVDLNIIESETDNPTLQIYKFLDSFTPEQAKMASWFAKIDDDTFNDIHNSVEHLNAFYDSEDSFYLVAELRNDMEHNEIESLKKINLFDKIDNSFSHELEGCWFSKKAINKIIENEDCKKFFSFRKNGIGVYTDQTMGAAAKLCKIYPVKEKRFTTNPNHFTNCSIFDGGEIFHFHPICKTKNEKNWKIINYYFNYSSIKKYA